jgi:hypothetical protein
MIVRRLDDGWTLIRQMDHAAHCLELARAWKSGPYGASSVSPSLEYAAGWHDLGWTETDKRPELNAKGEPMNFTQIDEKRHSEFYSRAVRTIARTDPYAAYLVSLHASGLYSRRYGWAGLKPVDWTAVGPYGEGLLKGEREFRTELFESIAPERLEFENVWRDYMLLETFDFLSLLTSFGVESTSCGPVPTAEGQWEHLLVRRLGPWEVELSPFPFTGDKLEVKVERVQIHRPDFGSTQELRSEFDSAQADKRHTVYRARVG